MNELAKEYPFVHIYAQHKVRQPVIIKANTEGLSVLLNAIVSAITQPECNGMAEIFDGDAEAYEVIIKVVNTHYELSPVPYEIEKS
jgi:hypothetical protein